MKGARNMLIDELRFGGLLVLLFVAMSGAQAADSAGQVQNLSGTLSVQRPDGAVRILSQKSEVTAGDVLTTQKDSYAQINFSDGSSMTMRPNTQMKIDAYQFTQDKPESDNAFFRLLKGGLRTVTGLVGKRGNQDAYKIGTSTATIGIRGSSGDTLDCSAGCAGVTTNSDKLPPGVYHTTYTGAYILQNQAGSQIIGEGQFGFVKDSATPPQVLPADPGVNLNLPFVLNVGGQAIGGAAGGSDECSVR
jgi:hypothetical protein